MYGDFSSDTGMSIPVPGVDVNHLDPNRQRQRLAGAMLAAKARQSAMDQYTAQNPDLQTEVTRGNDTLDAMTKTDPSMNQPSQTAMPLAKDPTMTLAHANLQDQPATEYVNKAQGNLDQYQKAQKGWRAILGPALLTAASIGASRAYNGQHLQDEIGQEMDRMGDHRTQHYQSLVNQVKDARVLQQQEYEADQRNRQQDIIAAGNNQTKALMARIMAGSREAVANTNADARMYSADQSNEGVHYRADTGLEGVKYAANQRAETARANADAALNRFMYGQDRADQRQRMGFQHADLKPTADEDRRADLARAAQGYAESMLDIVRNRPELWGSIGQGAYFLGGRGTTLRSWLGSNDPDVARMKYLKEQLGITQSGAHSFRSAMAIAPIADSLVNAFNTGPEAAEAVLTDAIKQLDMFTGVQTRPGVVGPGGQQGGQGVGPLTQQVQGGNQGQIEQPLASARPGGNPIPIGTPVTHPSLAKPGDSFGGFVFLGGNWRDQKNWREIKGGQ